MRLGFFINERAGVTSIEYGILAAGLAVVVGLLVADDGAFHSALQSLFNSVTTAVENSTTAGSSGGDGGS